MFGARASFLREPPSAQKNTDGSAGMPKNTNGKGPRRLAEAAPHCLVQALRRRANVLQPGSCSRLPLLMQLHVPNCEACMLKAPEPIYVHTQLLRTLCMTAILHRILIHISKEKKQAATP